ncbi:MAG: hypothetical protein H7203_06760 [Rhizobacter sp.]|nr:hypothetical protein [Burkholderiales bacterium]
MNLRNEDVAVAGAGYASNIAGPVVSWGAVLAGASGAAALSLILLILGVGLGLSSISPWAQSGISGTALGVSTIAWITCTQIAASGLGGYLSGRLRTRWAGADVDEVYFRDTAHGFLTWAVASLVTAALLTSTVGSIVGAGVKAGTAIAGTAATVAAAGAVSATSGDTSGADMASKTSPMTYFVDTLFRKDAANVSATVGATPAAPPIAEVTRIFVNAGTSEPLSAADSKYLAQLVSQQTGLPPADAEKRVNDTFVALQTKVRAAETAVKEASDKARKASAYTAMWLFISLLIGAFVASLAGTIGGRQRDQ